MYAIVDCNNFYASCEELFNPKLSRKPLVILSNNDGIVIARSQKAKAMGIPMGAPIFEYKPLVDSGAVQTLSCNFALYADMSNRVMQVLESFTPDLEVYSIDEAFLTLETSAICPEIRKKIKQWTGIPVSIGVGKTKTLAKLANRTAKKREDGIYAEPETMLETTPLDEIWGIGSRTALQIKKKNIFTPAELCSREDEWIRKTFGVGLLRTVLELRGTPCLESSDEKKQSIACTRTFHDKIGELSLLHEAVASFAARAAQKLREQESKAQFLSVFIATSPFDPHYESRSAHFDLPHATAFAPDLISLSKVGVSRLFRPGTGYKRAGVMLANLVDADVNQLDLLAAAPSAKKTAAMQAIDQINARYHKQAIHFLAEGKQWKGASSHVSPHYTTDWNDLLRL